MNPSELNAAASLLMAQGMFPNCWDMTLGTKRVILWLGRDGNAEIRFSSGESVGEYASVSEALVAIRHLAMLDRDRSEIDRLITKTQSPE